MAMKGRMLWVWLYSSPNMKERPSEAPSPRMHARIPNPARYSRT